MLFNNNLDLFNIFTPPTSSIRYYDSTYTGLNLSNRYRPSSYKEIIHSSISLPQKTKFIFSNTWDNIISIPSNIKLGLIDFSVISMVKTATSNLTVVIQGYKIENFFTKLFTLIGKIKGGHIGEKIGKRIGKELDRKTKRKKIIINFFKGIIIK